MANLRKRKTVRRTIHFYRVDVGLREDAAPELFDPAPTLKHIHGLSFASGDRYWEHAAGEFTCCWVDGDRRLRLATVRRSGLPLQERIGKLTPLPIARNAGLAEQSHVAFFRDNIVGAEFNFFGPRLSRLEGYFAQRADGVCPRLRFMPLLRTDAASQLAQLGSIRMLQLRVHRSAVDWIAQANQSLGEAFEAAARVGDAEEVEIVLRVQPRARRALSQGLFDVVRRLFDDVRRADGVGPVSAFRVGGMDRVTGHVTEVDLLSEYLVSSEEVVCEAGRSRALDKESAYNAIATAYDRLHDEIVRAAAVAV